MFRVAETVPVARRGCLLLSKSGCGHGRNAAFWRTVVLPAWLSVLGERPTARGSSQQSAVSERLVRHPCDCLRLKARYLHDERMRYLHNEGTGYLHDSG